MQLISCHFTPQQNGVAERKHRHILEIVITFLTIASLPSELWYFACAHSVLLINRMPCKSLSFSSPYLTLYKKAPDTMTIKIFGSVVFPWLKPYNVNKLQPRSIMCVFLGYSQCNKEVICYNIQTKNLSYLDICVLMNLCFLQKWSVMEVMGWHLDMMNKDLCLSSYLCQFQIESKMKDMQGHRVHYLIITIFSPISDIWD